MTNRVTSFRRVGILLGAAMVILGYQLMKSDMRVRVQAQDNQPTTTQTEKPFDQAKALDDLKKSIAGRENKPAEEVFKNIQKLKGMPAARLLRVMEMGYSRSLGVTCTHCHVAGEWEKDDKPTKPITREMMAMVAAINNDYLKNIKNLKGPNPTVNCTTCHRGQIKPGLNLPDAAPKT